MYSYNHVCFMIQIISMRSLFPLLLIKTVSRQIQSDWFCSFVVNRTLNFLFYVARQNVMFFSGGWIDAFQRSSRSKKFCQ